MPNDLTPEQAADLQRRFMEVTRERSLFEIVEFGMSVLARLDESDGEVTPGIAADLEALGESLEQKTEVYAAMHRMLLESAEASKRFARNYTDRAKQQETRADMLKARLLDAMRLLGRHKIQTATATAAIQNNSSTRLVITLPVHELKDKVPAEFWTTPEPVLNEKAIRARLEAGDKLSFAHLERGTHLRFR